MSRTCEWVQANHTVARAARAVVVLVVFSMSCAAVPSAARGAPASLSVVGGSAALRATVARVTTAAAGELPGRLGAALPDSIRIVLCRDVAEFQQVTGMAPFAGLLGVAQPRARQVALNLSQLAPGAERGLAGTLRHELAHLALAGAAARGGVRLPVWFDEGVASWFGGRYTDLGAPAAARLTRAPWLELDRLAAGFPSARERRQLAYAKSLGAIEQLEAVRSGCVAAIVHRVARGETFAAALERASGLTVSGLESQTRRRTRRRWLLGALLRSAAAPYTLLALLVMVGFVLRRWRFHRRLAAWEREEQERGEHGDGGG